MAERNCTCDVDQVCNFHRAEQELYWTGKSECHDCGAPFNNANPSPSGRCVGCEAGQERAS